MFLLFNDIWVGVFLVRSLSSSCEIGELECIVYNLEFYMLLILGLWIWKGIRVYDRNILF